MAMFRQHVMFSSVIGAGYAAVAKAAGVEWSHAVLAGGLCGLAGMLPDLDSDSGKPVREIFGVTAAIIPFMLAPRFEHAGFSSELMILFAAGIYFLIRFGGAWAFRRLTVHRGMFHSLPAAIIAAQVVFLAHQCDDAQGRVILAGGVFLGFLSHLGLDSVYGVGDRLLKGGKKPAGGSPFKLASDSLAATACCWLILATLSYLVAVDQGFLPPVAVSLPPVLAPYFPTSMSG